jgi:CRISPR-associated endonuclease/helicase Cas3
LPSYDLFSHPGTALLRHLGDVAQTSRDIAGSKEIALEALGLSRTQFIQFVETVGVAHDFGKSTRYFQEYLLHRPDAQYTRPLEANHGALSAIFAYYAIQHIFRDHTVGMAPYLPYIGFLIVKRHHGDLKDVKNEIEDAVDPDKLDVIDNQIASIDPVELQRLYAALLPNVPVDAFLLSYRDVLRQLNRDKFAFDKWLSATSSPAACIFSLLCYSILISADKTEASGVSVGRCESMLTNSLVDRYREKEGFNNATTDINRVRNGIYHDVTRSIESINIAQTKIMSLTAPTGTGKTLTALSAALKLR